MIQYWICYKIFLVKQAIYIVGLHKSLLVHWQSLLLDISKNKKILVQVSNLQFWLAHTEYSGYITTANRPKGHTVGTEKYHLP